MSTTAYDIFPSYPSVGTVGFSDAATFVCTESKNIFKSLRETVTFDPSRRYAVLQALESELEECSERGWDGYNAEPVSHAAYFYAYKFVEALPCSLALPTVSADADGHLVLEWYVSTTRLLNVAISADGELFYSGQFDGPRSRGCESFLGHVPQAISVLIRRVYGW